MLTRPHHGLMRRLMLYALCRSFSCTRRNGIRSTTSICMKNCCHASQVDRRQNSFASSAGLMVFCSGAPPAQRWAVLMATEAAHISSECPRTSHDWSSASRFEEVGILIFRFRILIYAFSFGIMAVAALQNDSYGICFSERD